MSYRPNAKTIKAVQDINGIQDGIAHVFQDAQLSLSGHRKLVVILKGFHKRAVELKLEDAFAMTITNMINRILPLKKGEQVADRIIKFCSVFVASSYKDQEVANNEREGDDEEEEESPIGKFVDYLLRHLLRGIQAKDRHVRFRVVQFLAYLVNNIGEIDEELFTALQWSLNRRLYDKEANVRLQAIVAISRFQFLNIPDSKKATESLLIAMQHDESAEVRRAAMLNLENTPVTIPFLIERARDTNSINRRLVYSRISKEIGDFRELSFHVRENMLSWGLNDRDPSVEHAAINMFTKFWYEIVQEDLLELIENLNVVNSQIADAAMACFYNNRPDFLSKVSITKEMWKELTTELSFFIRTFYEYCTKNSLFDLIDKFYPESIELSELLSKYLQLRKKFIDENRQLVLHHKKLNHDFEILKQKEYEIKQKCAIKESLEAEEKEDDDNEQDIVTLRQKLQTIQKKLANSSGIREETKEKFSAYQDQLRDLEFIIVQLTKIAINYDFSDEIGRREMLRIIRSSLTNDELSDELIKLTLQILRKISISERDFSAMCTEIINDIRDVYMDDNEETFHSAISIQQDEETQQEQQQQEPQTNQDIDDKMEDEAGEEGEEEEGSEEEEEDDNEEEDNEGEEEQNEEFSDSKSDTSLARKRSINDFKQPPNEILIQCLFITQHLLEIIEESIDNLSLSSLLDSLVRPSVLRNDNLYIRKLGMKCLGLFCLLEKTLAIQQLYLFGVAASKADEELRILSVQVIIDILCIHGTSVLDLEGHVDSLSLAKLFYKLLKLHDMPRLQCVVAEGLCKLFLADVLNNFGMTKDQNKEGENEDETNDQENHEKILFEALILTYFHPLNVNNHPLRQILAFCIPVYAFSHIGHQEKIASISGDCFFRMFREGGEFTKYENTPSASNILQQLIHWCDANNLVKVNEEDRKKSTSHFWQVLGFLQAIEQDTPKNIKKVIITNLHKFNITEELGTTMLKGLKNAIEETKQIISNNHHDGNFNLDIPTEKSFDKFYQTVVQLNDKAEIIEMERLKNTSCTTISQKFSESNEEEIENKDILNDEKEEDPENIDHEKEKPIDVEKSKELEVSIASDVPSDNDNNDDNNSGSDEDIDDINKLNDSLEKIDQLLDEEDNVSYEVEDV